MTPSEYFSKPVLGKIVCRLTLWQGNKEITTPDSEYEYIGSYPTETGLIYLVNEWNDEMAQKIQLVASEFVIEKTEY